MKYKSIQAVAEELRNRGELDEGKYERFVDQRKYSAHKKLISYFIVYTICAIIAVFPIGMIFRLVLFGAVTALVLGFSRFIENEHLRLFRLYNCGVKTNATVEKIHKNVPTRGGVSSIISLKFEDQKGIHYSAIVDKVEVTPWEGNVRELLFPNTKKYNHIKSGDILPILYLQDSPSTKNWMFDEKENTIYNVKK